MEQENLDKLFDFESEQRDLVKEAKVKSRLRMIGITVVTWVVVIGLVVAAKVQITPRVLDKQMTAQTAYYTVRGANTLVGPWKREMGLTFSQIKAPLYKWVGDTPVVVGELTQKGSDRNLSIEGVDGKHFGMLGEPQMVFYHPSVTYPQYTQEINQVVDNLQENWVEVGISFDKAYTLEEVKGLLPSNVRLQWCWVDGYKQEVLNNLTDPFGEEVVMGLHMIDAKGSPLEDPQATFKSRLEWLSRSGGEYKGVGREWLQWMDTQQDLPIIGVVVVGQQQALKDLVGAPYVKATSLGSTSHQ